MFTVKGIGHDNDDGGSDSKDRSVSWKQLELQRHLDWSDQQRRILTDNGNAETWYHPERGYPFTDNELPHYFLQNKQQHQHNISRETFLLWKLQQQQQQHQSVVPTNHGIQTAYPIVGIWERTLFYGGFEYTTNQNEYTYNIQTTTLFIDLRIPKTRDEILRPAPESIQSFYDMNMEQLRYYARQHIFAGYTKLQSMMNTDRTGDHIVSYPYCATRYHCIDWNYVGIPRSRPNKWYIELPPNHNITNNRDKDDDDGRNAIVTTDTTRINQWKEWAYATNQYQQHYYCEHWKRHIDIDHQSSSHENNDDHGIFLILRKCSDPDGIIIILNDHIMYCIDRDPIDPVPLKLSSTLTSLVAVVDEFILQRNDIDTARKYLSIQGGHGRWVPSTTVASYATSLTTTTSIISCTNHDDDASSNLESVYHKNGGSWILDHCIEFWKEGQAFFSTHDEIVMVGTSIEHCTIQWQQRPSDPKVGDGSTGHQTTEWSIFDTNLDSVNAIRLLLLSGPNSRLHLQAPPPPQEQQIHHRKL